MTSMQRVFVYESIFKHGNGLLLIALVFCAILV